MASKRDKKQDIPTANVKSWLEELAAEVNLPEAPDGWFTMNEICERLNRDHQFVRRLLKQRNAEKKDFKYITSAGKAIITPHYKL
jgi:DNA polymerase I-like protein with 3'-5' exonuclease and polymerase domains